MQTATTPGVRATNVATGRRLRMAAASGRRLPRTGARVGDASSNSAALAFWETEAIYLKARY